MLFRSSADSLDRLARNPLRILDSKDEGDRAVIASAPLMADSLNEASRAFFARVRDALDRLGIAYRVSPRLVRGLDYYTHTAFEFTTTALGAQGAVIAGGRYDGLMAELGGPPQPGVGWAGGIERLAMLLAAPPPVERPVTLVPIGPAGEAAAPALADRLRRAGVAVDLAFRGKPGARLKRADRVTLYRALDWLCVQGVARRITDADGVWRYEAAAVPHRHPHAQCVRCGATACLDLPLPAVPLPPGFRAESVELLVRGVCAKC